MMKNTFMPEESDKKRKAVDNSYLVYKGKKREISPIRASHIQTATGFKNSETKRSGYSPETKKELLVNKVTKMEKQMDFKRMLLESRFSKSIKSLPLAGINNNNFKSKVSSGAISDRYSTKSIVNKKK
jgi:hypothetical protein